MEGRERKGKEGRRLLPLFILKRRKLGNTCIWKEWYVHNHKCSFLFSNTLYFRTNQSRRENSSWPFFFNVCLANNEEGAEKHARKHTYFWHTSELFIQLFLLQYNGVWEKQGKETHEDWTGEQTGQIKKPAPRSPRVYKHTHYSVCCQKNNSGKEGGGGVVKINFLAPPFDIFSLPPLRTVQFGVLLFLPPLSRWRLYFFRTSFVKVWCVCVCKHKCFTRRPQKRTDTPLLHVRGKFDLWFLHGWLFFRLGVWVIGRRTKKKSCPPSLPQSSSRTTTGLILAISAETPFFRSWISFHFLPRTLYSWMSKNQTHFFYTFLSGKMENRTDADSRTKSPAPEIKFSWSEVGVSLLFGGPQVGLGWVGQLMRYSSRGDLAAKVKPRSKPKLNSGGEGSPVYTGRSPRWPNYNTMEQGGWGGDRKGGLFVWSKQDRGAKTEPFSSLLNR